jgi:hypothetical protein
LIEPSSLALERLPRQTLHHAWAPKLGRVIMLNSTAQLGLWALLEAHPGVTRYCERPSWPGDELPSPSPDFWALRDGKPVWLALRQEAPAAKGEAPCPADASGVQTVTIDELDRHRVWITNWLSLLPYLTVDAWPELESLREPVIGFFRHEASFDDAERYFARLDPVLVRTAVIAGLHQGRLYSAELLVRLWDGRTRVSRCPPRGSHAPQ